MDEPSAVLAHDEVANLFRVIRELTSRGIAVIYISHRLEEIREIGDRVTVLKDGRTSAVNLPARTTTTDDLVTRMTGRTIEYVFPRAHRAAESPRTAGAGAARGDRADPGRRVRRRVAVGARRARSSGSPGWSAPGARSCWRPSTAPARPQAGEVRLDGRRLPPGRVTSAVRAGLGLAPEERKSQALILEDPIYRNVTLATFARYATGGLTRAGRRAAPRPEPSPTRWRCSPRGVARPVKTLSGGNQQKVVLGRWLLDPSSRSGPATTRATRPAAAGRADPRRRRRRARRPVPGHPPPGRRRPGRAHGLQRGARGAGAGRPGARHARGPRRARGAGRSELDEETVLDLVMAGSLLEVDSP